MREVAEQRWSEEGCGGAGGAGDDTWHRSRAEAAGVSADAVAAVAHLCLGTFGCVSRAAWFLFPLSEGCGVRVPSPFSACAIRGHLSELPFCLHALHSLFLLDYF